MVIEPAAFYMPVAVINKCQRPHITFDAVLPPVEMHPAIVPGDSCRCKRSGRWLVLLAGLIDQAYGE